MAGVLQLLVLQQYSPPVWPSTVTCTTQTANLSYSALQNGSQYRLRYLCSYLHHTNSTSQLFCTAYCVTLQAQIFMQLPAPHKQHTSVILHCKMCHTTCSDIQAVICNHRNSTPQLFCTVKCVTLKYSYSYLQPWNFVFTA